MFYLFCILSLTGGIIAPGYNDKIYIRGQSEWIMETISYDSSWSNQGPDNQVYSASDVHLVINSKKKYGRVKYIDLSHDSLIGDSLVLNKFSRELIRLKPRFDPIPMRDTAWSKKYLFTKPSPQLMAEDSLKINARP